MQIKIAACKPTPIHQLTSGNSIIVHMLFIMPCIQYIELCSHQQDILFMVQHVLHTFIGFCNLYSDAVSMDISFPASFVLLS